MVTVMFIVIVIVIVIVQLLVFKRITLICEITLICVITLVCVILHVLKNTFKYSLNDALFFFVSSNHSHLPTLSSRHASAQAVTSKWHFRTTSPTNTNSWAGEN